MAKGYLFISNSTKPAEDVLESTAPIGPNSFSKAAIWAANEMGWELHMGVNRNHPEKIESIGYDIKFYNQHSYRNIFALKDNWIAYKNLCAYLKANPQIEIIHCNTPIGGVVGRLAGKKFNKKVIYTAHGFHFYKGAPLFNRTILKWVEKWLARYTDILITINQEDYEAAQKFKLKPGGKTIIIPGVGIDLKTYEVPTADFRRQVRKMLGVPADCLLMISLGDLVKRKNYSLSLKILASAADPRLHYIICGDGPEKSSLISMAEKLGVGSQVHFLGYRSDIKDLLYSSDIFIFTSLQEGLPRSTMEAMAAGLPCVVSDIRGNRDLIDNGKGGYLCLPNIVQQWVNVIKKLVEDETLRNEMGRHNMIKIKYFDLADIQLQFGDALSRLSGNAAGGG